MKKKILIIGSAVLAVVIAAVLVFVFVFGSDEADNEEAVRESCISFVSAYSSLDGATAGALLMGVGDPIVFNDLSGALASNVDSEIVINSVTIDKNQAIVEAEISSIDIESVFKNAPNTINDTESAKQYLVTALKKGNNPTQKYKVDIVVVKQDGKWRIKMNDEFSNALMGGYNDMLNELTEEAE